MPVEVKIPDLVRMGVITEFEADEPIKKIAIKTVLILAEIILELVHGPVFALMNRNSPVIWGQTLTCAQALIKV